MRKNWFYFLGHGFVLMVSIISVYSDMLKYGLLGLVISGFTAIGIAMTTLKIVQTDSLIDHGLYPDAINDALRLKIGKIQWLRIAFMVAQLVIIDLALV